MNFKLTGYGVKKTIAIFAYKQLGLNMDIETKICSACPESQGIELDNLTTRQLDTFEH